MPFFRTPTLKFRPNIYTEHKPKSRVYNPVETSPKSKSCRKLHTRRYLCPAATAPARHGLLKTLPQTIF